MRAAFLTLGCKVNSYETEAVWELMQKQGYERVGFHEESDVYLINTCTVTNNGDVKSRKMIREAVARAPGATVVVMGCLSQLRASEILGIPGVDVVVGTKDRDRIPEFIALFQKTRIPLDRVTPLGKTERFDDLSIGAFEDHQRAFLKIQDGCNNFCAYCIIPYARGRVRSKAPERVLSEARELVSHGYKELILTGIHTGGYGLDLEQYRFSDLLSDLERIDGLERIRISSIETSELTAEVLAVLKRSHKIVNHLHIPLQSGSEAILRAMNRKYDPAGYRKTIAALRELLPDLAVTTDVIVGFPGETAADFAETKQFLREIGFSELHVFPFSKRNGTLAAQMEPQVPGDIKKARVKELLELSDELAKAFVQSQVGKILSVLPETRKDGFLVGHTGNYLSVRFPGPDSDLGQLVQVRLIRENYPLSEAERT